MAKDYFQDITPPSGDFGAPRPPQPRPQVPAPEAPLTAPAPSTIDKDSDVEESIPIRVSDTPAAARGIRNITAPTRPRPAMRPGMVGGDMRESPSIVSGAPPRPPRASKRWLIWGVAVLSLVALAGLGLLAFRSTTVTVTPRSHTVVFTPANSFTAYPAATAASGTLSYTTQSSDFEDSEVVPVSGSTTIAASKASGSITVFNAYSTASVHLVKNTRFQTPAGLIFRVPADIVVPGMKGTTPGRVQVTVFADATGDQYNIAPTDRFTLPGLKSNAAMYAGVYAQSTVAMSGGAVASTGPAPAPGALEAALADVQGRLQSKAQTAASAAADNDLLALPGLMQITYTPESNTTEAGGGIRIHEKAHVEIPLFQKKMLAQTIGQSVAADTENAQLTIVPGSGFMAHMAHMASSSPFALGSDPIEFTLAGQTQLVWTVDTNALAAALAGRDSGAFQTIVKDFPGVQEAHARIEPFWKTTFPSKAADIRIDVTSPQSSE